MLKRMAHRKVEMRKEKGARRLEAKVDFHLARLETLHHLVNCRLFLHFVLLFPIGGRKSIIG